MLDIRKIVKEELERVFKIDYPYYKIEKLVDYYKEEFEDYMNKQGWDIFQSDSPSLNNKYNSDNNGYFWQVQVIDEPYGEAGFYSELGNALIGITTDQEAFELARKTGLMVDELGAVYGFQGNSLLGEDINIPVNVGDEILTGKFKNKKTKVKSIDKNDKGDVTINDKPALKFRIPEKTENVLNEEYSEGILYGYHVTSIKNWENIKQNGLKSGIRAMQGKGLYAFYDYEHAVRYAMKGEVANPILIKFIVTNPSRFLILNMDIAKEVLGSNDYHLYNQIEQYFYGGFNYFYEQVKIANPNMTIEKLKEVINTIEVDNSEMKQRTFVFSLIPSDLNDKLNIIWNGNYGLEYRINRIDLIKIVGYKNISDNSEVTISIFDKIPNTKEFESLINFLKDNLRIDSIGKAYKFADEAMMQSRNIRDWEYYENILNLLKKIK